MPIAQLNGIDLYYETHGEGPAVTFLHGAGGNHISWWQQTPVFSQRYRCITLDHRNFGRSTDPERLGSGRYIEDLEAFEVIEAVDEVRCYHRPRLGVMCQTTTTVKHAQAVLAAIRACNPGSEVRFADTICHPTKDHQQALEDLLDEVDALVVVGGRKSNNTRQLAQRCRERGKTAYHVQDARDLRAEWFDGVDTVGLTAGTSTLDETIEEVRHALLRMAKHDLLATAHSGR